MIIVQTPLRVSFFGGGTDIPSYYLHEGGCVLSSAIDKYIFVSIKTRFDDKIRVGYTETELVDHVDELQHDLIREAIRITGVNHGVEITTMGDIPSAGSRHCMHFRASMLPPSVWRVRHAKSKLTFLENRLVCRIK